MRQSLKTKLLLATLMCLTLGLSPHSPEPHIFGKIRWVMGGANGMVLTDWWDLILHGAPWLYLFYTLYQIVYERFSVKAGEERKRFAHLVNDANTHIIDVRELSEYNSGHVVGAINMPLSGFNQYIDKVRAMSGPKVVHCKSGGRSAMAVKKLKAAGINDVIDGGGIGDIRQLKKN